jgi:hypothetical protein
VGGLVSRRAWVDRSRHLGVIDMMIVLLLSLARNATLRAV